MKTKRKSAKGGKSRIKLTRNGQPILDEYLGYQAFNVGCTATENYYCSVGANLTADLETIQTSRIKLLVKRIHGSQNIQISDSEGLGSFIFRMYLIRAPYGATFSTDIHGANKNIQEILDSVVDKPFKAWLLGTADKYIAHPKTGATPAINLRWDLRWQVPQGVIPELTRMIESSKTEDTPVYKLVLITQRPSGAACTTTGCGGWYKIAYSPKVIT